MGFLAPSLPSFDHDEWRARSHLERIKPLAIGWVESGFGPPYAIYVLKIVLLYSAAGLAVIGATTHGLGGLSDLSSWWTEPIVYQKAVAWTLVYEILGLGCGSMPLTFRFLPPFGGFHSLLRPGTVRPHLVSFLPSMRYYAGDWATSRWLFKKGSGDKLNAHLLGPMQTTTVQLTKLYDERTAELLLYKGMVNVADMASRQPWLDDQPFPVRVMAPR